MAKLGEGDSRWIVQDREDGRNCGDWHWTERDLSSWAHKNIKERMEGKDIVSTDSMVLKTTEMSSITGDCSVMNRKKKVICSFDLTFELSWEGKLLEPGTSESLYTVKGKFKIPDCDDSTVGGDQTVDVTCAESNASADKLLAAARNEGRAFVRAALVAFQAELKETHGVSNKGSMRVVDTSSPTPTPQTPEKSDEKADVKQTKARDVDLGDIEYTYEWRAPVSEIWDVLTNQGKVCALTRSQAQWDPKEGAPFSLLGGGMLGTFTKVDGSSDPRELAMQWRLDTWQQGHFSDVAITFTSEEEGVTIMKFKQVRVPYFELERTREGWKRNFWEPIKMIFGFGFNKK